MWKLFRNLLESESGATAVEYGLIIASVALVIVGTLSALGTSIGDLFTTDANTIKSASP